MKKLFLVSCFLMAATTGLFAQKYMTRTGKISFDATAPKSVEKIEAINNEVGCVIDGKTGDVIFQVLVKSFKFEREAMQEHFNEDYMESDKYPKVLFKGNITNPGDVNFTKDGTYNVKVKGTLNLHNVTKEITTPATIIVKGNTAIAKAKFMVNLKEYNITIASLVADKVGKDATITIESNLTQK